MTEVNGSYLVAKALRNEGVDTFFYVGGFGPPAQDACLRLGMKGILVRNETAAGMMAHAYSRVTGKPGIVLTSEGPGTANNVPSMMNALADACPVVAFGSSASLSDRHSETFQEMDQVSMMRPATKWAAQATHTRNIPEYISIAFRHALTPPYGPVYLDFPNDVERGKVEEETVRFPEKYRTTARAFGDPALIERAIELLAKAERPLVFTGTGVFWSKAEAEMKAFIDKTGIPFYTTPQGRGAIPEDHPRFFPGARSMAAREADVVLVVGTRSNVISGFFRPPRWNPNAEFIVVNLDPREIGHNSPAEIGIVGDAKAVFGQLAEAARGRFKPDLQTPWIEALAKRDAVRAEESAKLLNKADVPIHPLRLCRELRDFMGRDTILAVDGHETLNFARQSIPSYLPGHRLNAGTHGTMGVSVPFGVAAKVAFPNKQVVVLSGDGAFGWQGMEVETAVRLKLNVLFVVNNNGTMTAMRNPKVKEQQYLGHLRYDKMMEAFGGHGEFVEDPKGIRPALDRAVASNKPALVNVVTDPSAGSQTEMGLHM